MRRTSLTREQATQLASVVRTKRSALGLSIRQVAAKSGLQLATISGLETGDIRAPQPDTLKVLAGALQISVTDLYAAAEWLPANELPSFRPYMRAKYQDLTDDALAEVETFIEGLARRRHGKPQPANNEDENE